MQRAKIFAVIVSLWVFCFVKIACVERNLYFPDYYYPFNTSNSQIIGVYSSDCNYLKHFLTSTSIIVSDDINYTESCIQVINPLYSAITNNTLNYDVYQHFVYYTLTNLKTNGNLTLDLVNNTSSLVHHLFLYDLSNFRNSIDSLTFWVSKLSNINATTSLNYNNNSLAQVLISNSVVFHFNDQSYAGKKSDSFMYDECGTSIRLDIECTHYPDLVKENQTALITHSSDVMQLSNQEIVKCYNYINCAYLFVT